MRVARSYTQSRQDRSLTVAARKRVRSRDRKGAVHVALCTMACIALGSGLLRAQAPACSCGAAPPPPAAIRTLAPYANTPEDLRPFSKFTQPYYENYTKSPEYNGAARDVPAAEVSKLSTIDIGFLGPIENHKDQALGRAMLHGAQLAIDGGQRPRRLLRQAVPPDDP